MRTEPPFQALIFDAGGVFVPHDHEVLFARLASRCSVQDAAMRLRAVHDRDPTIGTGETTIEEVHRRLQDELGYDGGWEQFLDDWSCHLELDREMLALMTALAAENRVLVLSNTNARHWARVEEMCGSALERFELYLSHEIGVVKPDLSAFALVTDRAGLTPGRCLFIDDRLDNVQAARRAGFQAEQFTSQGPLEALLEDRGVRWAREKQEAFQ